VRGARKLRPGEYILWRAGAIVRQGQFWQVDPQARASRANGAAEAEGAVVRTLRETLDAAVASQLVSDVPVGVFLSGGIDSSLVAAFAQRHCAGLLTTFSIGFADADFDESPYARRVASHLATRHIEQVFSEDDLLKNLDDCLSCLDEPMGDPSVLPTYVLSQLAARHVKVVLGGDGGDELWAGYPTYNAHRYARWYRRLPRWVRAAVVKPLVRALPVSDGYQSFEWKAKRFALRWAEPAQVRHMRWMSNLDLPDLALALGAPPPAALGQWAAAGDSLDGILALDFTTYLPGSVLAKVDRAAMAHGLEVRPPMLDNALIELAFSVPASMKVKGAVLKSLLKQAACGLLPDEIIHRRKKGFAIPLAGWTRGPLVSRLQDLIASSPVWDTGLLNRAAFAGWLRDHRARAADRSRPLWALLVLDHWYRKVTARQSDE